MKMLHLGIILPLPANLTPSKSLPATRLNHRIAKSCATPPDISHPGFMFPMTAYCFRNVELRPPVPPQELPLNIMVTQEHPSAPPAASHEDLSDLVLDYADLSGLPPTDWLTRLKLQRPRRDVRCLPETARLTKRLTDIVISSIMLICLAPIMLLVAIAVKLTSRGPMIFSQTRVGLNFRKPRRDRRTPPSVLPQDIAEDRRKGPRRGDTGYGRPFVLYKFRTMRIDAEKNGAQFAQQNDPRVTSIGRFLRKTRLDELPQLWNVLKGDMSLVGPRPERPEFIEQLSSQVPGYLHRLGLKPGLTGIAQVVNGYDNNIESFKRKVALDLLYLQNCCFWNDFKILLRTIKVVLTGSGAL